MTDTTSKASAKPAAATTAGDHAELNKRIETLKAQADALKERVESARSWVEGQAQTARGWAAGRGAQAKELVEEEPLVFAGVSAGLAFLIGIAAGVVLVKLLDD